MRCAKILQQPKMTPKEVPPPWLAPRCCVRTVRQFARAPSGHCQRYRRRRHRSHEAARLSHREVCGGRRGRAAHLAPPERCSHNDNGMRNGGCGGPVCPRRRAGGRPRPRAAKLCWRPAARVGLVRAQHPGRRDSVHNGQVESHDATLVQRWRSEHGCPLLAAHGRNRRRGEGVGCGCCVRNDAPCGRPYRRCGCGTGSALSQPGCLDARAREPTLAVAGHGSPTITPRGDDAQPCYCHARRLRGGGQGRRRLGPPNMCYLGTTSAVPAAAPPRGRQRERQRCDVAKGAAGMCSKQRRASEDHVSDISLSHGSCHYLLRTPVVAVQRADLER